MKPNAIHVIEKPIETKERCIPVDTMKTESQNDRNNTEMLKCRYSMGNSGWYIGKRKD